MRIDRRQFIAFATVIAATGGTSSARLRAQPAGAVMPRMRLEDFSKDAAKVASLRKAVQTMKARRPSDPTSWFYQAAVHGVTPDAVAAAQQSDAGVGSVDQARFWNQCPHFDTLGLASVNFIVWHRAYVYYFERILRAAAGDPTLSLPYWNYGEAAQRRIPAIFADATGGNPLFEIARTEEVKDGGALDAQAVDATRAMRQTQFIGASAQAGFAGSLRDLEPSSQGTIEISPHNMVHGALGGAFTQPDGSQADGLMGDVTTAAFDPIFWAHHCNIDRLWTVWECRGKQWGSSTTAGDFKTWLAARPWWFNDADGQPVNRSRTEYIKRSALGIVYDTDNASCTPLSDTLPAAAPVALAAAAAAATPAHDHAAMQMAETELGQTSGPIPLSTAQPTARSVPLTKPVPPINPALAASGGGDRVMVQVVGLTARVRPALAYDVYVDLPAGTKPSRETKNFVGTATFFAAGAPSAGPNRTLAFDVTDLLRARGSNAKDAQVTLVPVKLVQAPVNPTAAAKPAPDYGITVNALRVVTMPPR